MLEKQVVQQATDFEGALNRAHDFLIQTQDPKTGGWPSQFKDDQPSIWSSSHAILALLRFGQEADTERIRKALKFIIHEQNQQTGGWPEARWNDQVDSTFITADCLRTLAAVEKGEYQEELGLGIGRLIEMQNEKDGGWGFTQGDESRVRSTAVALADLAFVYSNRPDFWRSCKEGAVTLQRGMQWLASAGTGDGGWGLLRDDSTSNVSCTAWGLWALCQLLQIGVANEKQLDLVDRAARWLLEKQGEKGNWNGADEPPREIDNRMFPSVIGVDTPFVVRALLRAIPHSAAVSFLDHRIHRGIVRLVLAQCRQSGGWILENDQKDRGCVPRTWATPYYLMALLEYARFIQLESQQAVPVILQQFVTNAEETRDDFFLNIQYGTHLQQGRPADIGVHFRNNTGYQGEFLIQCLADSDRVDVFPSEHHRSLSPGDTGLANFRVIAREVGMLLLHVAAYYTHCDSLRRELVQHVDLAPTEVRLPIRSKVRNFATRFLWPILLLLVGAILYAFFQWLFA